MPKAGVGTLLCGAQRNNQPVGTLCTLRAGWGTDHVGVGHCRKHGGNTATHKRSAAVAIATTEVRRLGLAEGQAQRAMGPAEVLLEALWCAHEDLSLYRRLVSELAVPEPNGSGHHDPEQGPTTGSLYADTFHLTGERTGEAKRHVLVALYEDAQRRCESIATSCLRAKVEEQRVKIAQERAETYADAMRQLVSALGHSPADPQVRQAMRASLTLVAGHAS